MICALFDLVRRRHVSTSCGVVRRQETCGVGVLKNFIKAPLMVQLSIGWWKKCLEYAMKKNSAFLLELREGYDLEGMR
jgi:hypothetical protein